MKTLLKEISKPIVHEAFYLYSHEADYKEYDAIDKEMMHSLLLHRFTHDLNLIQHLDAIDQLIKHAKIAQEKGSFTLKNLAYDTYLKDGLFLVEKVEMVDGIYHFSFPSKIQNTLINLKLNQRNKEHKIFKTLVDGFLEVYGVLTFEEIEALHKHVRPDKLISFNTLEEIPYLKESLLLKGVRVYEDGITHPLIDLLNLDIDVYLPKKLYEYEYYLSFASKAFDDHIYDYYGDKKYQAYRQDKMKNNLGELVQNTRLEILEKSLDSHVLIWPIWTLGGRMIQNNELDISDYYN